MQTTLRAIIAGFALLMFFGCPINNWSPRQVLWDRGYSDISFGEVPGEESRYPFFARRGEQYCSGIVDIGSSEPEITVDCGSFSSAGH